MIRSIHFAGLLVLTAALALADQKAAPVAPLRPAPGVPKGGVPKGGAPKAARLTNPGNPIVRLYNAAPEQRERALEKLPPARQEQARKQFAWFDGLSKDEQRAVLQQAERFDAFSPEKQRAFQQQMRALNQLPPERRRVVRAALQRLGTLSERERSEVFGREAFKSRFSPEELKIISDLSEVLVIAR